jgi:hypothetical protein
MITIKNWDKLTRLFRSKIEIRESDILYVINYYYPTLKANEYYTITLCRINPPQPDHEHKDEYLMLCGDCKYWLSKTELNNIDDVYEAIIDVVCRHNFEITGV